MNKRWFYLWLLFATMSVVQAELVISETRLAEAPDDRLCEDATSNHMAWVVKRGDKVAVVVDGQEGQAFDAIAARVHAKGKIDADTPAVVRHAVEKQEVTSAFMPDVVTIERLLFSPYKGGRPWAYQGRKGSQWYVVVDGKLGRPFDKVGYGVYFRSGKCIVYEGCRGGQWYIVADGEMSQPYDKLGWVRLSRQKERLYFIGTKGESQYFVIDGVEGPGFDSISSITLSPDEEHVVYIGKNRKGHNGRSPEWNYALVLNGEVVASYDWIGSIEFSPNSKRLAYGARKGEHSFVIVDGQKGPDYDCISWSKREQGYGQFSGNSEHYAYCAAEGETAFIIVDGQIVDQFKSALDGLHVQLSPDAQYHIYPRIIEPNETGCYVINGEWGPECEGFGEVIFSEDGSRWAYVGTRGTKTFVVSDAQVRDCFEDEEKDSFRTIQYSLMFSPKGRHLVYITKTQDSNSELVIDAQRIGTVKSPPYYSPNGQRLAYVIHMGGHNAMIVDGELGPMGSTFNMCNFSPDSQHVGYSFSRDDYKYVVLDGMLGTAFDELPVTPNVLYSEDSRYSLYWGKRDLQYYVVVNGQPGPAYDRIFKRWPFHKNGDVCYLGIRDDVLYRVTVQEQ